MEQTSITIEAIDKEITFCENFIGEFETKLEKLQERTKHLTERLDVLRAVYEKLPVGMTKEIVQGNIGLVADERFDLIPEINKCTSNIKHYNEIIDNLNELKKEIE